MTRLLLGLLVLLGAAAFVGSTAEARTDDHQVTLRGTIKSIAPDQRVFVLDTLHRGNVRVRIGPHTRIALDGHPAHFGNLKVGQKARVTGRPDPNHDAFILRAKFVRAFTPDHGGDGGDGA